MASISWTPKGNSNTWNTPANWSLGRLPESTDGVTVSGSPVIYGSGYAKILTIKAGTVTIGGTGTTAQMQQSSLIVDGDITNDGKISLNPGPSNYSATLEFDLSGTLSQSVLGGTGTIQLSDSALNFIESGPNGVALDNQGNTIEGAGQFGNGSAIQLDNHGKIEATQPNNQLTINMSQTATNEGTIEALTGSKGLTIYQTTINSSNGGTISAAGSNVSLSGATLIGGTMTTSGTGVFQTVGAGNVINAVDNIGTIDVADATSLTLKGVITNNGNINVQAGDDQTYLNVDATGATLIGPGLVTLSDSSHNVIFGSGNPSTLDNIANVISGAGMIGGNGLVVDNAGVITATGVNNPLIIETGGVFTNNGVLSATGPAGLEIDNTTVNGALGGQIIANAPNAVVELIAAHLTGGTLSTTGAGAAIEAIGESSILDGTLTNVTNNGTVQVGAGATLQVWGTIKNTGNFAINGASLGEANLMAGLVGATLTGGGTVTMSASSNSAISGEGSSDFTNQNNTISGAGSITDMTLTNGGTIDATSASTALQITSDILFRSDATGDTGFYQISNGANVGWQDVGASSTAYSVVGVGDFYGTGTDRHPVSATTRPATPASTRSVNGVNVGWHDIGASSTAYSVVGVGDFTGNGTDDILYRDNATGDTGFYEIVNGVNTGWHDVGASSTAYSVVGVGDFTGSGTDDILYRNNHRRHRVLRDRQRRQHRLARCRRSSTAYSVVGVGDFMGNGTDDILYRDNTTGDTGFYAISQRRQHRLARYRRVLDRLLGRGHGDYLGNGTSDILFRNNTTGDTGFYAISNGVNTGWHDIGASSTGAHAPILAAR
jgi:hypothetical protein